MNAVTSHPFAHFALRTVERIAIGVLLGIALWAIGLPALAQDSAPENPGIGPRVQLVLRANTLQLIGVDGRDLFAIAEDGSVEFSGEATIDFSPNSYVAPVSNSDAFVRVRIGGHWFRIKVVADRFCSPRGCPQ